MGLEENHQREVEQRALDPSQNTRDWIEAKLGALRAEMRALIVLSVAGNQVLGHISFSPTVGYVASGGLVLGVFSIKLAAIAAAGR